MARFLWLGLLAGLLVVNGGCRSTSNRHPWCAKNDCAAKPMFAAPPAPSPLVQTQGVGGFPGLPPGAIVNPPPGANIIQPGQKPAPSISNSPPETSSPPRNQSQWEPTEPREPSPRDVPPSIRLYAPEPIEKDTKEPPAKKQTSLPAIAEFTAAKDNVYAGLRPPLDGLDWLQTNGIQTVVQIRLPGDDDSTDRQQVEARKLRYIAFEVSPQTLTREKADEFIKLIQDGSRTSIFVYDRDGSLAGSMWYLYQRFGELHDDDSSQLRARPLGLQTSRDGQHRDMWLAVQKLLSENSR